MTMINAKLRVCRNQFLVNRRKHRTDQNWTMKMTQDKVKFFNFLRLFIGIQIYTMMREKHCSRGFRHLYKVRVKIQQPHLILVINYVINYTVSPRPRPVVEKSDGNN